MNEPKILFIQQILFGLMLFMGMHLCLSRVPVKIKGSSIHLSKQIIGITLLMLPLGSFVYFLTDLKYLSDYFASALIQTSLYLTSIGMTIGFLILLGEKVSAKSPLMLIMLSSVVIYPVFLWTGLVFGNSNYINFVLIASHAIFTVLAVLEAGYIAQRYSYIQHQIDDYYADELKIQISWMSKYAYLFIGFIAISIVAVHFITDSIWVASALIIYSLITYLHIYIQVTTICC